MEEKIFISGTKSNKYKQSGQLKPINFYGLELSASKMVMIFSLLLVGLSLITFGMMDGIYSSSLFKQKLSDEEIKELARKLGMVELKELILDGKINTDSVDGNNN